jgi:hypothetical protein
MCIERPGQLQILGVEPTVSCMRCIALFLDFGEGRKA